MNKDFLKEFATAFFYNWYNSPGTNTEQGFESWYDTEEAQSILRKHGINTHVSGQSEQLPPTEDEYICKCEYDAVVDSKGQCKICGGNCH